MTNEELVEKIRSGENPAANMTTLWTQNNKLIRKIVGRYHGLAEPDDLMQEAYLGLHSAAVNYAQDRGSFISFAVPVVRGYLLRYVENSGKIRIPNHLHQRIRAYNNAWNTLAQEHGREPTDGEIRAFMGLSVKEYASLLKSLQMRNLESLDAPLLSDDDGEMTLADTVPGGPDPAVDAGDQIYNEEVRTGLWSIVDELPHEEAAAIRQRYQDGLEYGQIAENLNITYHQARDAQVSGIRNLRKPERRKRIQRLLPERIASMPYHGTGLTSFRRSWTSATERTALKLCK